MADRLIANISVDGFKDGFKQGYQKGKEDAITEMVDKINEMPTIQDGDVIYPMPIEMIAEMVKEQKDEK